MCIRDRSLPAPGPGSLCAAAGPGSVRAAAGPGSLHAAAASARATCATCAACATSERSAASAAERSASSASAAECAAVAAALRAPLRGALDAVVAGGEVRQLVLEHAARAEQPRHHGADRHVERVGDVLVLLAAQIGALHHIAVLGSEPAEGGLDLVAQLVAVEQLLEI